MTPTLSSQNRWIGILFLFYFFGTLGIAIPALRHLFLPMTPLNLILTLFIFFKVNKDYSLRFMVLSGIIFGIGYAVEAVGVSTGVLFGTYWYGSYFGPKLFETPILIGVNWLFLSLSTYGAVQYFIKNKILLVVLSACLMTGLDFFIEPVAMELGFWNWANNHVPMQNFVMWFIVSSTIQIIISVFNPKINTTVSFAILLAQFVFFVTLYACCAKF